MPLSDRRIYIHVEFENRDHAKALSCRWDGKKKAWYVPVEAASSDRELLLSLEQMKCLRTYPAWLDVPYNEKNDAKECGTVWVPRSKVWVGDFFDFAFTEWGADDWHQTICLNSWAHHDRPAGQPSRKRRSITKAAAAAEREKEDDTPISCEYCDGHLVVIGNRRKNGAPHRDWDGRTMHKQCWKKHKENEHLHFFR
jgi:hypothetical protein